ncbi:MAG: iron uptake porin [Symploca sp. SIO1B1]|nr:iron uptake porin [Symploca sp. SIO1B1]
MQDLRHGIASILITGVLTLPVAAQTRPSEVTDSSEVASSNQIDNKPVITLDSLANSEELLEAVGEKVTAPVHLLAETVSDNGSEEQMSPEYDDQEPPETAPMGQVTSVSQLSDVQATDWAFDALRSLVENYGCIQGFPDGTFRGNQPLTRYQFAAGLKACLEEIERLIAAGDVVSADDFETLQRLMQDFAIELASLETRVDNLDGRTAFLEDHQFSTTTKLFGQVVMGVQGRFENTADFFPVDGVQDTADPGTEVNLISNSQLSLFTQFSPRSLLLTGLQAGTGGTAPRLTNDTRLGYEGNTDADLVLSDLTYRHLVGDNFAFIVGAEGVNAINVFRGANRVESAGFGPISALAQRNPIIAIGGGRAGVGFDWQISDRFSLQSVYSVRLPEDPDIGGIFGSELGENTVGVQLTAAPTNTIDIALNYINSFSPLGRLRTGIGDDQLTVGTPINTNAFGGTVSWRIIPQVTLGAWGGYANSARKGDSGTVETTNWMVFLNFPDLGGAGNLAGIYVGQPPKITSSDLPTGENIPNLLAGGIGTPGGQPGTTTHLELFYRYRLSDNIAITPGFIVIFNPAHTPESETIGIAALRTTFTF